VALAELGAGDRGIVCLIIELAPGTLTGFDLPLVGALDAWAARSASFRFGNAVLLSAAGAPHPALVEAS